MEELKTKYRHLLRDLIGKHKDKCDFLEIRLEKSVENGLAFNGAELESLTQKEEQGGYIRALVKGGWGTVSFNALNEIESCIGQAIESAKRIGKGTSQLASVAPVEEEVLLQLKEDPRAISLEEKVALFSQYNQQILKSDSLITSSRVGYFDQHKVLWLANSLGTNLVQEKLDLAGRLTALASDGKNRQAYGVTFGSSDDFGVVRNLEQNLQAACQDAVALVSAPKIKGGAYPVIVDPILTGVFAHEAFGHLSEGDNVYENEQLQKVMQMGTEFGRPILNIYDTGLTPGSRAYLKYDDEGVPTEKTDLIQEGKLVGRLHSLETAGKMGEKATGNARALSYKYPPICRMRNTCIGPGTSTFEEMIKDIDLGVYAVETNGGQTNGEIFAFVASKAYMIRKGQIAEMVRDVSLSGNVFETLKKIDAIGNDFTVRDAAGGCGKAGQWPLPTAESGPHIRIESAVIGGN